MPFYIYSLTSPSGKSYIGVSKDVRARLRSHERRARDAITRHPLYDAMRKYGPGAFTIETLWVYEDRDTALAVEVAEIFHRQTMSRKHGYNVSPGGEYDCFEGSKRFWERMYADPIAFAAYRANLSAAQSRRAAAGLIKCPALVAYNAALSPREKWYRAHRALRMANNANKINPSKNAGPKIPCGHAEAVKAAWEALPPSRKKRHAIKSKERAKIQWAVRTQEERKAVAYKISVSVSALSNDAAYRKKNLAGLEKGRNNVDRTVQGPAASKGLKAFWEKIKTDPERYQAYIASRNASLKQTLLSKGFVWKG